MLFALTFVLGAWCLQQMPELPSVYWAFLLVPALFIAILFRQLPIFRVIYLGLFGLLAGYFWALLVAQHRLADELPTAWETKAIQIEGVVASLPQQLERGERFEFDVEKVLSPQDAIQRVVPKHISITQYHNDAFGGNVANEVKTNRFHAGERWRLTVKLKRPHGTANPHGFDFEVWALERNIRAVGSIKHADELVQNFVFRPKYLVEAAREKIHTRMQQVLGDKPYAGVLEALAIGDESGILQQDWQVFLRTGVNHLMSISGLHITMLAGLAYGLVAAIWRRSESLVLCLPTRKAAVVAGAIIALLYALVAGFSVPSQRTLYMLAVMAWAVWSGRQIALTRVLAYTLFIVVLLDPWSVLAAGFWLSFGAVAIMGFALGARLARPHWLSEAVHTQWAVTLGLIPLLLVLFQQVSIISPLANAIAIPLVSLVVVPLTLLGAMLPVDSALHLAHWVMAWCMKLLIWMASFPLSTWQQHAPPSWTLPVAILGVMWTLMPRGFPLRYLGLFGLLPMLLIVPKRPAQGEMHVAVLDVGQGLAVVVQTQHHDLLYDTGPKYSSQSDSGSRIIVPYLRGEGIRQLDGLVVSHNDADHSGGMVSVLSQVPVKWLASSLPDDAPELTQQKHLHCFAGQNWLWDGVHFEVLHPSLESYENTAIKDNNRSCVLRISNAYGSVLLAGDIEKQAEAELLENASDSLASDILVVPHHGSKTSSTLDFIAAVNPQVAIFTMGYRNRFGHPKADVVNRYQQAQSRLYRSDQDGAILIDFTAKNTSTNPKIQHHYAMQISPWRRTSPHYWYAEK